MPLQMAMHFSAGKPRSTRLVLGEGLQRQGLAQTTRRVALARVVLHMKDMRHTLGCSSAPAPDMVAEAVGEHRIGPEVANDLAQLPDSQCMQPVGDHDDLQALLAQGLDLALVRAGLAAQHQQNLMAGRAQRGQAQVHRDLGGTGESSGHEVKNADRCCALGTGLGKGV